LGLISGNLAFITTSTAKIGVPAGLSPVLLAGVIVWQSLPAFSSGAPSDEATARPWDRHSW
jgi:hypothetical protein